MYCHDLHRYFRCTCPDPKTWARRFWQRNKLRAVRRVDDLEKEIHHLSILAGLLQSASQTVDPTVDGDWEFLHESWTIGQTLVQMVQAIAMEPPVLSPIDVPSAKSLFRDEVGRKILQDVIIRHPDRHKACVELPAAVLLDTRCGAVRGLLIKL